MNQTILLTVRLVFRGEKNNTKITGKLKDKQNNNKTFKSLTKNNHRINGIN